MNDKVSGEPTIANYLDSRPSKVCFWEYLKTTNKTPQPEDAGTLFQEASKTVPPGGVGTLPKELREFAAPKGDKKGTAPPRVLMIFPFTLGIQLYLLRR